MIQSHGVARPRCRFEELVLTAPLAYRVRMTTAVPETVLIEPRPSRATLVRLANSCARLASRGTLTTSTPQDIDAADYRIIAEVLRAAAEATPKR